ncbi:MAG: hypothetical protein ACR2P6_05805 [Gammaproteobacteria bacterium]
MDKLRVLFLILASALLISCGGGSDDCDGTIAGQCGSTDPIDPDEAVVTSVQLLSSLAALPTDQSGNKGIDLSALVRDQNSNIVSDTQIIFSIDCPSVVNCGDIDPVNNGITSSAGVANARLTSGTNAANRTITVTALEPVSGVQSSLDIDVTGTTVALSGAASVGVGQDGTYNLVLTDSESVPVKNTDITISSANGNALNPATTVNTGETGGGQFVFTPTVMGIDTLSADALNASDFLNVDVTNDQFAITVPVEGAEIELAPNSQLVSLTFIQNGNPAPNGTVINFASTRGTLDAGSATTAGGVAEVNISSTTTGPVTITATDPSSGATSSVTAEFIATDPAKLALDTALTDVLPGQETSLTATVWDANDNRVKNVPVRFSILADNSGGGLALTAATSDSNGQALNFFRAGQVSTAKDGVIVEARVIIDPNDSNLDLTAQITLTVAGEGIEFVLGTGNTIYEIDDTRYGTPWSVILTDAVNGPVTNQIVQIKAPSVSFDKGFYFWNALAANPSWAELLTENNCPDEDSGVYNLAGARNGFLDANEDFNGNGVIDAGNVVAIIAKPCAEVLGNEAADPFLTTDDSGTASFCVVYQQSHAGWVDIMLEAYTSVAGTEFLKTAQFELDRYAPDFNDSSVAPPGYNADGWRSSPYGSLPGCDNADYIPADEIINYLPDLTPPAP